MCIVISLVDELRDAFELSSDEFLKAYNFPKPDKDQNIVFSCAKGTRSSHACSHFVHLGYEKYVLLRLNTSVLFILHVILTIFFYSIFNYSEGWYGWASHH